jgi:RimK family alpha-L-glutamate ligase
MRPTRILCLGAGQGWHSDQLRQAAAELGSSLSVATYESLRSSVSDCGVSIECDAGNVSDFDVVLTRTMPAGSLEQITFRLATLHSLDDSPRAIPVVNPPRSLEIAIDKYATLARVAELGYSVPDTIVVQSRKDAIDAFKALGGDCVVKPVFGGEGRGVMRIRDPELAWYAFSTLETLGAVGYVQKFIPPGGRDTRWLVIGETVIGLRRTSTNDFRTNVAAGASCEAITPSSEDTVMARRICGDLGLKFAAVDLIDTEDGSSKVVEVNAIPGWKGAQRVTSNSIARLIIETLVREAVPVDGVLSE